jgi:hypothetical protein
MDAGRAVTALSAVRAPVVCRQCPCHLGCLLLQDAEASDAMDAASQLMGLSMIMRQAVKLIKGVEVTHSDTHFTFGLFSLVTWFKVGACTFYSSRNRALLCHGPPVMHKNRGHGRADFLLLSCVQITESYPLDGTATQQSRRDLRSGEPLLSRRAHHG